jgi:hypothetical protein
MDLRVAVGRLVEGFKDAVPAAGAAAGTAGAGAVLGAPGWLVGLGQAVVVVFFTLRGIDKRLAERDRAVAELDGKVSTLKGRIEGLHCQGGAQPPAPVCAIGVPTTG